MESGEGFMSVMDHGVEVSIEHLPKIPCSKFTIIGNSRMRNKKPVRKKEQMWKVPKGFRRHQTEREKSTKDMKQSLQAKSKSLQPKFGNQEELNRFDKNGIYGDAFQRTLDLAHPWDNHGPAPRRRESKIEKKFIDDYYRNKNSLFLPGYGKKNAGRNSNHVPLPSLSKDRPDFNHQNSAVAQSCEGAARHYCDVVGQRYCTACLRMHRLDKLAHKAREGDKEQCRNAKSKLGTALPNIRTNSLFDKDGGWTSTTPNSNGEARTKSSYSQKHDFTLRSWERVGGLAGLPKGHEDRKRRKVAQMSSLLSKKLPEMFDIATDNDSRHLNS